MSSILVAERKLNESHGIVKSGGFERRNPMIRSYMLIGDLAAGRSRN